MKAPILLLSFAFLLSAFALLLASLVLLQRSLPNLHPFTQIQVVDIAPPMYDDKAEAVARGAGVADDQQSKGRSDRSVQCYSLKGSVA